MCLHGADRFSDCEFADAAAELCRRLKTVDDDESIAYRHQNGGDYDSDLVLRPELAPGDTGISVHYANH